MKLKNDLNEVKNRQDATADILSRREAAVSKRESAVSDKEIKVDLVFEFNGKMIHVAQLHVDKRSFEKMRADHKSGGVSACGIEQVLGLDKEALGKLVTQALNKISTAAEKVSTAAEKGGGQSKDKEEQGGDEWWRKYYKFYQSIPPSVWNGAGFLYLFVSGKHFLDEKPYLKDRRYFAHFCKCFVVKNLSGPLELCELAKKSYEAELEAEKLEAEKKAEQDQKFKEGGQKEGGQSGQP